MQPEQQTPTKEQHPAPSIDDLIAQASAETHAFEGGTQKQSVGRRLAALPKTRKVLLVSGLIGVIFIAAVIGLTLGKDSPKQNTLPVTAYGTADVNGDGVIDEKDTAAIIKGDTNGDGVVDSRDDAAANTTDAESASWWSSLFAKANSAISSNRSDDTSDESTTADNSYEDTADSEDDQMATDDETDDSYIEETDPDEPIPYTEDPVETEYDDPVDTKPSPAPTTKSSTMLTVASWNVLGPHNDGSKTKSGINTIFKHAQVIGLQEVGTANNTKIRNIVKNLASSKIGVYQPTGNTPIVWNASMYAKKASGYTAIESYGMRKVATYVKLQNKANGQQFYVFNIHAAVGTHKPNEGCSTRECKAYKHQMRVLSKFIASRVKGGIPIFATGDYNADYRFDRTCKITWYPCRTFKKLNMYSGYAHLDLAEISKSGSSSSGGSRLIDYVFVQKRNDVMPISSKIIGESAGCRRDKWGQKHCWHNSDHKPVLLTVRLK